MIIKLGMLQDDKFYERSKEFLIWKNTKGEWTTVTEYLARHQEEYKSKIFYGTEDQLQSHVVDLYKQKDIQSICVADDVQFTKDQ